MVGLLMAPTIRLELTTNPLTLVSFRWKSLPSKKTLLVIEALLWPLA